MLRILYTLIEGIANFSALLCPIAIGHWLLVALIGNNPNPLSGPINIMATFFKPFNTIVAGLIPALPSVAYQGQTIPLHQPVFGMLLTGVFFILTLLASVLKNTEQRMAVQKEIAKQDARRLTQERLKLVDEQRLNTQRNLIVYVGFQFGHNPNNPEREAEANSQFYQFEHFHGRMLQSLPDGLMLLFDQPEQALKYTTASTQGLQEFFATLRPMDPRPDYRLVLDVAPTGNEAITVDPYKTLSGYCGKNQILLTDDVKRMLEYRQLMTQYPTESLGYYGLANGESHELFIHGGYKRR